MRTVAGPVAEVLLVAALVRRVTRFERSRSSDPYDRIAAAARTIAGEGRVADVIASEITLLYYAFFCWRKKTLREPVVVRGLAGLRKEIRAIAMLPDDDAILRERFGLLPH